MEIACRLASTVHSVVNTVGAIANDPVGVVSKLHEQAVKTVADAMMGDKEAVHNLTKTSTEIGVGVLGPGKGKIPMPKQGLRAGLSQRPRPRGGSFEVEVTRFGIEGHNHAPIPKHAIGDVARIRGLQRRANALTEDSVRSGRRHVIAQHGFVAKRPIVSVSTPQGPKAFYRREGSGTKNKAGAQPGDWAPFEGVDVAPDLNWFIKHQSTEGIPQHHDLFKYGTLENALTADWLRVEQFGSFGTFPRSVADINLELRAAGIRVPDKGTILEEVRNLRVLRSHWANRPPTRIELNLP